MDRIYLKLFAIISGSYQKQLCTAILINVIVAESGIFIEPIGIYQLYKEFGIS